ncbi:cupin domain-containing protein [Gracilibacillus alcaliphilus]|uniref:cupin domain-containing protein n=1 Tax=Gracilibacillus alcaliphilus TaxID=1401441 RepID=UPI00195871A3|nr:cupin domain-containing protein [Gracilibacillus alcaliphilus]MBM7679186.1 quercetin dioxygenase-like cupin family protein [Gracilibacillus alcaliphilus]
MTRNQWEQAEAGVTRKIHPPGQNMMMMEVVFEPEAEGASHSHPHEQLTYCLEGELIFTIDGKEQKIVQGDSLHIPSQAVHGVKAVTKSRLLDIFNPLREDLLNRE